MPNFYVADHTLLEYPAGGEMVDSNIYSNLGLTFLRSTEITEILPSSHYIISNAVFLPTHIKKILENTRNYSIMEHDYKIHPTRQPHRYRDNIFPKSELINVDFFRNAKNVFLQSNDHLDCYKKNSIEANFKVLDGSIWSDKELNLLEQIAEENSGKATYKFAIIDDKGPDKGTENAVGWCKVNTIDYALIPKMPQTQFYTFLADYPALVYFPNVKESFCRLVVEARCLDMNVIAPKIFGAVKEPWFTKSGKHMISFLKERSKINLETICKSI